MQKRDEFALGSKYITREGFNFNADLFSILFHNAIIDLNLSEDIYIELEEDLEIMCKAFLDEFNQSKMFHMYSLDEVNSVLSPFIKTIDENHNINEQFGAIIITQLYSNMQKIIQNNCKNDSNKLQEKVLHVDTSLNNTKHDKKQSQEVVKNNMIKLIKSQQREQIAKELEEKHIKVTEIGKEIKKMRKKAKKINDRVNKIDSEMEDIDKVIQKLRKSIKETDEKAVKIKDEKEVALRKSIKETDEKEVALLKAIKERDEIEIEIENKKMEMIKIMEEIKVLSEMPKESSDQDDVQIDPQQEHDIQNTEDLQQDSQPDLYGQANENDGSIN